MLTIFLKGNIIRDLILIFVPFTVVFPLAQSKRPIPVWIYLLLLLLDIIMVRIRTGISHRNLEVIVS